MECPWCPNYMCPTSMLRFYALLHWLVAFSLALGWQSASAQPASVRGDPIEVACLADPEMTRRVDCACVANKTRELRRADSSLQSGSVPGLAFDSCPSESGIREYQKARCLNQKALMVPKGIDASSYCECLGSEIALGHLAHAPARIFADTEPLIHTKANDRCAARIRTPAAVVTAIGLDLSGAWMLEIHGFRFDVRVPEGKWQDQNFQGTIAKVFTGTVIQSIYASIQEPGVFSMYVHPITKKFVMSTGGAVCETTAEVASDLIRGGECINIFLPASAAFTMRRVNAASAVSAASTQPHQQDILQTSPGRSPTPVADAAPAQGSVSAPNPVNASPCQGGSLATCIASCGSAMGGIGLEAIRRFNACQRSCRKACQ